MFQATVDATNEHGKIADVMVRMGEKYQPSDTTAELELDSALEVLKFGGDANAYYNSVIKTKTQYAVAKSDDDLIKLMATKINSATYAKMIVDHLNSVAANNFELICTQISTVQRLAGISNSKSKKSSDKEIAVVGTETATEKKKAGKNVTCNHCQKKGHKEEECWKKYPDQIPQWVRDKQKKKAEKAKAESETGGVEVTVAAIEGLDFQLARC